MADIMQALETIRSIYQMLEDDESREIYINRVAYYMTDNIAYLEKIVNTYTRLILYSSDGIFLNDGVSRLLKVLPEGRKAILYGAGRDGAELLRRLKGDARFIGFCSSTKEKQKSGYLGLPVMSPAELLARKDLYVVISTRIYRDEIMELLKNGGYPESLIIDGPAFYTLNADLREQYFGPEFMKFEEKEIFVDAGCYDLGTTLALARHCKSVKSYAFEPDPKSYQRCLEVQRTHHESRLSEVTVFPYGTWSHKDTLRFSPRGTGGSHICSGDLEIPVMPIDEAIISGDRITMIKMDVEGAELESLKGAKQTIIKDKPKLAICIYHKPEDMWEIPLYIKELVPEYRLYIRHHCRADSETVLYAVMPE